MALSMNILKQLFDMIDHPLAYKPIELLDHTLLLITPL